MSPIILGFALLAIVLTVSALASGLIERAPLSFPMIFLGLGLFMGEHGLGLLQLDVHHPALEIIATLSLALVLFLDAVNMQVDELREDWLVPLLTLGPGTLLTVAGVAGAAYVLLGTPPLHALLLGAILASTDPVVLRDVLRNEQIPRAVRRALGVEAGMNDLVVLPLVLILIAVLKADVGGWLAWLRFLGQLLVLSPLVGLVVGGLGAWVMGQADARFGIRRAYQALYGLGLVLGAFAAGQAVHGDGFLTAFFAGLAVTLFNVALCDCFLEYGEVTAEMAMLLAFVLFGAVLSSLLSTVALLPPLVLALLTISLARPLALGAVLLGARMSYTARAFIGWFGPRGLSSLLLALLVVQAHVPAAAAVLAVTGVVVLVSVVAHGVSATPLSNWYGRRVARATVTFPEERESTAVGLFQADPTAVPRITPQALAELLAGPHPPIVLDVRARAHHDQDTNQLTGGSRGAPAPGAGAANNG